MDPQERSELIAALRELMASQTGSTSDLIRAVMSATTDGLIDSHRRMTAAGMPEWMIGQAMELLIGGSRTAARAGAIQTVAAAHDHEDHRE